MIWCDAIWQQCYNMIWHETTSYEEIWCDMTLYDAIGYCFVCQQYLLNMCVSVKHKIISNKVL